jgi:hypothetical protein
MTDVVNIIKAVVILLIILVVVKVGLAIMGFFGFLLGASDYLNSIPYLSTIILIILSIIVVYYVFIKY